LHLATALTWADAATETVFATIAWDRRNETRELLHSLKH
jgi:hypothetical protein